MFGDEQTAMSPGAQVAQGSGQVIPVFFENMFLPLRLIAFRPHVSLDLFLYDLARPILRGKRNAPLAVTGKRIFGKFIRQRDQRQPPQFAQSIRPMNERFLHFAAAEKTSAFQPQHCLIHRVATCHYEWFANRLCRES